MNFCNFVSYGNRHLTVSISLLFVYLLKIKPFIKIVVAAFMRSWYFFFQFHRLSTIKYKIFKKSKILAWWFFWNTYTYQISSKLNGMNRFPLSLFTDIQNGRIDKLYTSSSFFFNSDHQSGLSNLNPDLDNHVTLIYYVHLLFKK